MTPTKTRAKQSTPDHPPAPQAEVLAQFEVKFTPAAEQDLVQISDQATVVVLLRRAQALQQEPLKQGKPLRGVLKNCRSVRAAGQRYRIVYQVAVEAGQVVVVVIGLRKAGDKNDASVVAEKRLSR
jgi:mRNA interferase RelE/StbE